MDRSEVLYEWRGPVTSPELVALHAEGFGEEPSGGDREAALDRHSVGWVCARSRAELVGFVNVVWDGGAHAFLLDTVVAEGALHQGIGTNLVHTAAEWVRRSGCRWLQVDFEDHLQGFYLGACGFRSTPAGVMDLGK
jgi:GNAT superfamily N-acetyltransferase